MGEEEKTWTIPLTGQNSRLSDSDRERFASMAKALGHPIRLDILCHLKSLSSCMVGRIVDLLPVAQSTTSQHLKILKESGWIQGTIEGTATCYCVDEANAEWFKSTAGEILG